MQYTLNFVVYAASNKQYREAYKFFLERMLKSFWGDGSEKGGSGVGSSAPCGSNSGGFRMVVTAPGDGRRNIEDSSSKPVGSSKRRRMTF